MAHVVEVVRTVTEVLGGERHRVVRRFGEGNARGTDGGFERRDLRGAREVGDVVADVVDAGARGESEGTDACGECGGAARRSGPDARIRDVHGIASCRV